MDPLLETYLKKAERYLGQISISDRVVILSEIRSQIIGSQSETPELSLKSVLLSLGTPEALAKRCLFERGLKPGKPVGRLTLKRVAIFVVGFFAILFMAISILISKVTPLISIDNEKERVYLLGGLIDIAAGPDSFNIDPQGAVLAISKQVGSGAVDVEGRTIQVLFTSANIKMSPSRDNMFRWRCEFSTNGVLPPMQGRVENNAYLMDWSEFKNMTCKIEVPESKIALKGVSGNLRISSPQEEISIHLKNGHIKIAPDPEKNYIYNLSMGRGFVDKFTSSKESSVIEISVTMENGTILRD